MTNIDKVIKGIECCRNGFCFACPYNDGIDSNVDCKQKWADDALELLKEAEPVKPHRNYKYLSDFWCDCGWHLGRAGNVKFCPNCGRKVKWGD